METPSLLKPDFMEKKFELIIKVYGNCQTLDVMKPTEDSPDVTYQELIGALEIQKSMLIYDQSVYNRKMARRKK